MLFACGCLAAWSAGTLAQSFTWYSSTEDNMWQTSVVKMAKKAGNPLVTVDEDEKPIVEFKAWAATFNELDWDALGILTVTNRTRYWKTYFLRRGICVYPVGAFP